MDGTSLPHVQPAQVELAARQAEAQLQAEVLAHQSHEGAGAAPVLDIEQAPEAGHAIGLNPHACSADCPHHHGHHHAHAHTESDHEHGGHASEHREPHGHETHAEPHAEIHLAASGTKPHAPEHAHSHETHGAIIHPPDCVCPDHAPYAHRHEHAHEAGIKLAHDCTGPDCCGQGQVAIAEQIAASRHDVAPPAPQAPATDTQREVMPDFLRIKAAQDTAERAGEVAIAPAAGLEKAETAASLPHKKATPARVRVEAPSRNYKASPSPPLVLVASEKAAQSAEFFAPKAAGAAAPEDVELAQASTVELGEVFVDLTASAAAGPMGSEEFEPSPEQPIVVEINGEARVAQNGEVSEEIEEISAPKAAAEIELPAVQLAETGHETYDAAPFVPMEAPPDNKTDLQAAGRGAETDWLAAERTVESPTNAENGDAVVAAVQLAELVAELRAYAHAGEAGESVGPDAPHQLFAKARATLVRAGLHEALVRLDAFAARHGEAPTLSLLLQAFEISYSGGSAQIQPAQRTGSALATKPQTFLGTIALSLLRLAGQFAAMSMPRAQAS